MATSAPPRPPAGCLTPADLAAFRSAVPGRAPAELARHVAGCARCQRRLLEVDAPRLAARAARRRPRPLVTLLILAALGVLAVAALALMASR